MAGNDNRVWFITGTSSGIGRSLAFEALARGGRVAVTARDTGRLDPKLQESENSLPLALDVADAGQCDQAVEMILGAFGRIDVLINNAGHGMMGAVEEVSDTEARMVFDSNVFGLLNVIRATLPVMRKMRAGHIVNIGSVGGLRTRAGSGIYGATKYALEGISEALYDELTPLGIGVTLVEPGPFRTEFSGRSLHEASRIIDDYAETAGAWRVTLRGKHGTQPGDPDKAAKAIVEVIDSPEPSLRLVLGDTAMERTKEKLDLVREDIERWRVLSGATDFD